MEANPVQVARHQQSKHSDYCLASFENIDATKSEMREKVSKTMDVFKDRRGIRKETNGLFSDLDISMQIFEFGVGQCGPDIGCPQNEYAAANKQILLEDFKNFRQELQAKIYEKAVNLPYGDFLFIVTDIEHLPTPKNSSFTSKEFIERANAIWHLIDHSSHCNNAGNQETLKNFSEMSIATYRQIKDSYLSALHECMKDLQATLDQSTNMSLKKSSQEAIEEIKKRCRFNFRKN